MTLEELNALLKLIPNIGGFAAMAIVLWALYTRRLVFGYQLEEAEKRRIEERDAMRIQLKERADECSEYTELAREALFNSRRSIEVVQTLKEGGK
jgi:hypothetical protein